MKRDWDFAIAKRDAEGGCRVCGRTAEALLLVGFRLEAAHTVGRRWDDVVECGACDGSGKRLHRGEDTERGCASCDGHGRFWRVSPHAVVPLCGPSTDTRTCHGKQHAGKLDLLPHLTLPEQGYAAWKVGIVQAYITLAGSGKNASEPPSQPAAVAHLQTSRLEDWQLPYPTTPPPPQGD